MLTLIGRSASVPTWGLFVALGNALAGGAVAPPLLLGLYGFVGRFMPTGATVETIRTRDLPRLLLVEVIACMRLAGCERVKRVASEGREVRQGPKARDRAVASE